MNEKLKLKFKKLIFLFLVIGFNFKENIFL